MGWGDRLEALTAAWRGPALAALVALAAALPGALALPPLDRDEARFAEASAQMLESGDWIDIRFQDTPRYKKPAGIYWLQAVAARLALSGDDRRIFAYRLPSVAGAMIAAAACAWGARAFLAARWAFAAGALLGASFLLSTEAMIAAADAALAGAVTAAMAALARLWLSAQGKGEAGDGTRLVFWAALGAAILIKGPIGPMVVGLAILALLAIERRAAWLRSLGWGWGLILVGFMVLPWAWAITVTSDGAFWGAAVGGDLAPKLVGGQEGHAAPPGYYFALAPLLLFPAVLLLPAAAVGAVKDNAQPAVRFALAWLVPSWLVFELVPTKLVHYPLPLYGALAWLCAWALARPIGPWARGVGAALMLLAGAAWAAVGPLAAVKLASPTALPFAVAAAALAIAAALSGALLLLRRRAALGTAIATTLAIGAHDALAAGVGPRLDALWLSARAARTLAQARLSPRLGQAGPVTVAGYEEPSLVFLLGAATELAGPEEAADAIAQGYPAIVEARLEPEFRTALAEDDSKTRLIGRVAGLDYSNGKPDILLIFAPP